MNDILNKITETGIVAVVRANNIDEAIKISEACLKGGINCIEITFTVPRAEKVIQKLDEQFKDKIVLGAGTVLNKATCIKAIEHGAKYIVSPGFDLESAEYCMTQNVPYIPGCMTITEMMNAMNHGVKIIKLFPGSVYGPSFIKSVKGPLPNIKIMPTGGVNLKNISEWFENGVIAVGIGSALTKYAETNEYEMITFTAKQYIEKAKTAMEVMK